MSEYGAPVQYRVKLDGGDVLVVTLEIEEQETLDDAVDAQSLGETLLSFLRGKPVQTARQTDVRIERRTPKDKRIVRPVEPNADEWLEQSSREALRNIAAGK